MKRPGATGDPWRGVGRLRAQEGSEAVAGRWLEWMKDVQKAALTKTPMGRGRKKNRQKPPVPKGFHFDR